MKYRTRTQEVEAIEYTGDNLEEVQAFVGDARCYENKDGSISFVFTDEHGQYSVSVDHGWSVIRRSPNDFGGLSPKQLSEHFEPIPDLIRTVADYEGLPEGTILEVVEEESAVGIVKKDDVLVKRGGEFYFAGAYGKFTAEYMAKRYVCSVVRLGGEQWASLLTSKQR